MRQIKTGAIVRLKADMRSARAGIVAFLLMSGCAATMAVGVGCSAYAEARLSMPQLGEDLLSQWVSDLDDRMTGACR